MNNKLFKLSAFSESPEGGNPAGVWLDDALPDPQTMLRIAAEVGYSETAFVAPLSGATRTIRYYSPEAEVSFCGHATIATGVVLGRLSGPGGYVLESAVGPVPIKVAERDSRLETTLESVTPRHELAEENLLAAILDGLGWRREELDLSIPPVRAYAGAWHLVLATNADRLARLDYDFDRIKALMLEADLTTLQLIHRESDALIHARDPFPVGGVVEDPATGAAAAALGGYLRDAGLRTAPFEFTIHQGEAMGRPSVIRVAVPQAGGIRVSGTAVEIPG